MNLFLDLISRSPVVADGGMGSMIAAHFYQDPPQRAARRIVEANREHAELVEDLHRAFLHSGAGLLTTNSFSLNRTKLATLGLEDDLAGLNGAAVKLARNARDQREDVAIGGSIGPLDPDYLLQNAPSPSEIRELFQEQANALEERGVDLFVLETFTSLNELIAAIEALHAMSELPILASFTIDGSGRLAGGGAPERAAARLAAAGVDVIGVNCSVGPHDTLEALARVAPAVRGMPLAVRPNAGFAQRAGGRVLYPNPTDAQFGDFAHEALALGARLIGGCCGVTPRHVHAIAQAVRETSPRPAAPRSTIALADLDLPPAPSLPPSRFATLLAERRFVVSVQLDPSKAADAASTIDTVAALRASGVVDVVDVNSKSGGAVVQDALVMSVGIQQHGMEAMPHLTPRDATVYGLASQLTAAVAWGGVRTVLVVTGDAPAMGGTYPETGGILHVDSIGLVRGIAQLGLPLTIGVAVNQNAEDIALELDRLEKKLAAGAQFVMTQPVFSPRQWEAFERDWVPHIPVPMLVGVWPLVSHAQALRINERVAGVVVDEDTCAALRQAGPAARSTGFGQARQMVRDLRGACAGVYVIAPFKRPREALEVIEAPAAAEA